MPVPQLPPNDQTAPAEVRAADAMPSRVSLLPDSHIRLDQSAFKTSVRDHSHSEVIPNPANEISYRISNRPEGAKYQLVYVNGLRTSPRDAYLSTQLVNRSLGMDDSEVTLLYNPQENNCGAGLKVLASIASCKLGKKVEAECVGEIKNLTRLALENSNTRMIIVGHSQGSLIIQNAIDDLYDEYRKSRGSEERWLRESPRIEIILYAPLIRTIAPGPEVMGLLNCCDLPARGIGGLSRAVANTKHFTGWREQQRIPTVICSSELNKFPDLLAQPAEVHSSFNLILADVRFNFMLLAQHPKTRTPDGDTFVNNLVESIRSGKRSDFVHHELIITGCDTFGASFAKNFLSCLSDNPDQPSANIGKFVISGVRLERIQRAACSINRH